MSETIDNRTSVKGLEINSKQEMFHLKTTIVSVIVGAWGMIKKGTDEHINKITAYHSLYKIQSRPEHQNMQTGGKDLSLRRLHCSCRLQSEIKGKLNFITELKKKKKQNKNYEPKVTLMVTLKTLNNPKGLWKKTRVTADPWKN